MITIRWKGVGRVALCWVLVGALVERRNHIGGSAWRFSRRWDPALDSGRNFRTPAVLGPQRHKSLLFKLAAAGWRR